jgi:hypothetical protein
MYVCTCFHPLQSYFGTLLGHHFDSLFKGLYFASAWTPSVSLLVVCCLFSITLIVPFPDLGSSLHLHFLPFIPRLVFECCSKKILSTSFRSYSAQNPIFNLQETTSSRRNRPRMRLILALVGLLVSYKVEASLTKYVYVCGETTYSTSMPTETVAAILDSNSTAKASGTTVAVASGSVVGGYLSASGSVPCNGTSDSTATSNAASASATGGDFYETVVATVSPVRASGTQSASTAAASVSSSGPVVVSTSSISSTAAKYSSSSSTTLQASSSVSSSSTTPTTTTTSVEPTATPFTPTPNSAYLAIAKSAITALTGNYSTTSRQWGGITGWIAANAYNDIMDYDHYTGSKTYENTYGAGLLEIALSTDLQGTVLSTDAYNDDQLWWCLSMLRAHTNYGHIELLTQTIKQWQQITESSLLTAADQGTAPTKGGIIRESVIPATCDVDGGVYWAQLGDSNVNAISTSLYVMVSAWLFEITKEAQYKAAADKSLGWLQRVMLDSKSGIMTIDSITPTGCVKNLGSLTYNTGMCSLHSMTKLATH